MAKIPEKLNFSDKNIYVGIDVHLKSWNISIFCEDLFLKSFNQQPSPKILHDFLVNNFPGAFYRCAYESGFCGYWIQRELSAMNINCMVVNAADVPQTDKAAKNKTDKTDSKRLALALKAGLLQPNFVPDEELEADRQLVRCNERLKNDLVRAKNRVKGLLYQLGIKIPDRFSATNWSSEFINWLKNLPIPNTSSKTALLHQVAMVEFTRSQKLEVLKNIRQLLKKERYAADALYLCSVPGIGPITAAYLLTEIGDIKRFSNFKQLNSFVGFYPSEFSSGENIYKGSISSRKNSQLRRLILEAAWTAVRNDPALTLAYQNLKNKIGGKRAIIKIARKLLSRIRHVWTKQQEYEKGIVC